MKGLGCIIAVGVFSICCNNSQANEMDPKNVSREILHVIQDKKVESDGNCPFTSSVDRVNVAFNLGKQDGQLRLIRGISLGKSFQNADNGIKSNNDEIAAYLAGFALETESTCEQLTEMLEVARNRKPKYCPAAQIKTFVVGAAIGAAWALAIHRFF
jgi:hypothetical protein